LLPLALLAADLFGQRPAPGNVNIGLWFDTEDYILPASDDAAKRIATFLTGQGIQATSLQHFRSTPSAIIPTRIASLRRLQSMSRCGIEIAA
jgi:hypothetical protein